MTAFLLRAEPVRVRHAEGLLHGFLTLEGLDGKAIADGQMTQVARGDRLTAQLVFHFHDGSTYEDTTVFSQRGAFRLLTDHVIQKGPSFKQPMETWIGATTGQVRVRYTEEGGKEKEAAARLRLPRDVANGLLLTLMNDVPPNAPETKVSMVAFTPKPRLVGLKISPRGEESFKTGASRHQAMHYVVKVEIGGVTGFVAGLTGRQPPDTHVWIVGGEAPAFVKLEGPLYSDGPVWRIQMADSAVFHASNSILR